LLPSLSSQERVVNFPSTATSLPLAKYFSTIPAVFPQATMLCHVVDHYALIPKKIVELSVLA